MSSQLATILAAFESHGLSETDLVSKETLYNVLNRMNGHQEFDENVYNEIWEECREDSFGKVEIRDFVDVVYRARHILSNRVVDSNKRLTELKQIQQKYKTDREYSTTKGIEDQIRDIEQEIANLQDVMSDSAIDLQILNKPFFKPGSYRQSILASPVGPDINPYMPNIIVPQQPLGFDLPIRAKPEQRLLLLFIFIAILVELLIMGSKNGFLNLLSYSMILVFYLFPKVPKHYWITNLVLLGASIPIDICWLALYAPVWWWSGAETSNSLGMQRFSIVMASILLIVKSFAGVLLFIGFKPTNSQIQQTRASRFI